jgi:putative transposase
VYKIAYHVIWCPKYRQAVLIDPVSNCVAQTLDAICAERGWPIISKEIQADHVHLFLTIPPAIAIADAVKILKGTTARLLFVQFPKFKDGLRNGQLWSPSYYVGSTGNVSAETIRGYLERSKHVTKRR